MNTTLSDDAIEALLWPAEWTRSRRGNLVRRYGRLLVTVFRLRKGGYRWSAYDGTDVGYCDATYATEAEAVRAATTAMNELEG